MKSRFSGKKVLITGASSGIGRACALAFAREGASLALVARNEERLSSVAGECRAFGVQTETFLADVSVKDEIQAAVSRAVEALGGMDIVHANAGIYLRMPAKELTPSQIERIMNTNFYGTLHTFYAILPHFLEKKSGSIVVTVSMDGKKGVPPDAAYVASKFALNGFLQVARQELLPLGIHVGAVFPSRTDTPQIAHVDCPKITPKADPALVAKAVLKCVYQKKKEILVPGFSTKLLVLADAFSPSLGDWMVRTFHLDGEETGESAVKEPGL